MGGWQPVNLATTTALNAYNGANVLDDFPKGIFYTDIQASESDASLPSQDGGTLITYKTGEQPGWSYQEFKAYQTNSKWIRIATSGTTWTSWQREAKKTRYEYTMDSVIVSGVSYVDVTTGVTGLEYKDGVVVVPLFIMTANVMYNAFIEGDGTLVIRLFNMSSADANVSKTWDA